MSNYTAENKRIAKNTLALYARTIIVMLVSLYVSRALLEKLGVNDFGVYSVVGSIVILFSFLDNALTQASQRFLTVSLGEGDLDKMKRVFNTAVSIQIIMVVVAVVLLGTVGVWFLNNRLSFPEGRLEAANYAFQFSIMTFCLNFLRAPYAASVVAYERLDFFAYASIVDALLKLGIVFAIGMTEDDRLVTYAGLLSLESFTMLMVYKFFCNRTFTTCRYKWILDKSVFSKMFSFSGWTLFGGFSNVATQNGFLFMLNMFCGVVANAAMGIANQVLTALETFIGSFQTSFQPQIVKSYAQGEINRVSSLINSTSKFSFALMFLPACLLIINIQLALEIWLNNNVPEDAEHFCQILIACCVIDAITGPFNCAIMATGKISKYQLSIGGSFLLDLTISYILFRSGIKPYYWILLSRFMTRGVLNGFIGLRFLNSLIGFDVKVYLRKTILPIISLIVIMTPLLYLVYTSFDGVKLLLISVPVMAIAYAITCYYVLFSVSEREYILSFVKKFRKHG
ncbi:MAG: MATE family efflux transporter [Paludibacteraceae bacterium]|nr:MATE family efflux transporter [Paludibacteraceae bacterium]